MHSEARETLTPLAPIPVIYRDASLDPIGTARPYVPGTPSQQYALDEAHRFVAGAIRSLVLVGPPGVGKSHLSAAIVNELEWRRRGKVDEALAAIDADEALPPYDRMIAKRRAADPTTYSWLNAAELVSGLRLDMDRPLDDRSWAFRLERGRSADLLVLDDLGREKVSDWTGELVYGLVNGRYESKLRTVATSNLSEQELRSNGYWPAISRLAEGGSLVKIDAPDHRLRR